MLRWVGHEAVALLDGGLAKWLAEGRATTAAVPPVAHTSYPARLREGAVVGVGFVQERRRELLLLDARAPARYRGEQEPIDPVAGRIPGALNRFNMDNVRGDGRFKSAEELKADFQRVLGDHPAGEAIHYCGSGVAACHNLLAMELAGLPGGKLYAGSWSEWLAD